MISTKKVLEERKSFPLIKKFSENLSEKSNFVKINLPTHVCIRRNYQLFLVITHWSYFKNNNWFYKLNVYKVSAKEHQVVHSWDVDEILVCEILFGKYLKYVPLILKNYKKQKRTKIVRFTYSSILSAQQILVTIVE